jgi:UDP-N-acetylglucosamine 2-epimerase (non-hydrolysing)
MKVKPVFEALERRGVEVELVHTGQHYDPLMNEVFFEDLGLPRPDHSLGVGSGSHAEQTAKVMLGLEPLLDEMRPDVVIVVGDVNSTAAAALVTAKSGALLAHVEAGLRSRDWRMPEEVNRVVTDHLSDYLLAPSPDAVENLRAEGFRTDQIHLVGNVMVDTLLLCVERARDRSVVQDLGLSERGYGLVTLHRPENVDDPSVLAGLLDTLGQIATELPLVLPAHPRLLQQLRGVELNSGIRVIDPLGYLDCIALESRARLVATDSGGIQEETTVLGVPCLTLRETTERPITVSEGTNVVVGRDPSRILEGARRAMSGDVPVRRPELWDGHAGERIADVLVDGVSRKKHPRPTSRL